MGIQTTHSRAHTDLLLGPRQNGRERRQSSSCLLAHPRFSTAAGSVRVADRQGDVLIGLLIAVAQLGLQIGPVLAGLGIVGFIIGFALQETLSNFASGVRDQADRILLGIVDKNELVLDDPVLVVPTFPAGRIFSRFHHSALGPKR